jgi:hypothetical protein
LGNAIQLSHSLLLIETHCHGIELRIPFQELFMRMAEP